MLPNIIAAGSAVELTGTVVTPFGAIRGRPELNPFENALFLWEAAQQHACTTYQTLLQTPLTLPAVGKLKHALAVLEGSSDPQPQGKSGDRLHRAMRVTVTTSPGASLVSI